MDNMHNPKMILVSILLYTDQVEKKSAINNGSKNSCCYISVKNLSYSHAQVTYFGLVLKVPIKKNVNSLKNQLSVTNF